MLTSYHDFSNKNLDYSLPSTSSVSNNMTDKKALNKLSEKPVIYVHAKGRDPAGKAQVQALLKLNLPICSHLANDGITQTDNGYDQPGPLLAELAGIYPGRPVIFLRAGLQPSTRLLAQLTDLLEQADQPSALSLLSNADITINPFSGLREPVQGNETDLADLVSLLAPGQLHTLSTWTDHFVMLSADLVALLVSEDQSGTLMQQLLACGGSLKVADHLFLHDPQSRVFAPLKLQAHETAYPPPFSELSSRLQSWFNAGITNLPPVPVEDITATLHITHSWGGGVAQWLKSFIETAQNTDGKQPHLQLRSEDPQSGRGYGQKLSLYAGNELRCPIASWWLQPSIKSISDTNTAYREILTEICRRYGIGRVFVSSLVGHSLDALRSGLPTLQILHDHFPLWPLLSVNPGPYLQENATPKLQLALSEHTRSREFPDKDAQAWSQIGAAYLHAINKFKVKIAAPGQSVLNLQNKLEPAFKTLATEVIPHGFPAIQELQTISPRAREDGRLRLVIPGRMQTGKGQQILLRALPELARHVHVYLLGTGKSGEAFFGIAGVDVVLEYKRDELPSLLATIGPDFAALLSVVPETFSFTLSELQQMHIPVIATRVGSFPNRIEHGKTGWLIDADSQALLKQIVELCETPEKIEMVRTGLSSITASTPENMLAAYNKLCPPADYCYPFIPATAGLKQIQFAAAEYQSSMTGNELQQSIDQRSLLQKEVKQRTDWALETGKQLKLEQQRSKEWVSRLESEMTRLQDMVAERQTALHLKEDQLNLAETDLRQLESDHLQLESDHLQLESNYQQLETSHQQLASDYHQTAELNTLITESTSWKITRPFRAARRVSKNFMLARAWNPARWPWLLSQLIRNLSTLGIGGTLERLQYGGTEAVAEPQPIAEMESIGDIQIPDAFPITDKPHVSIIIPVYNKWVYTAACLRSLQEVKGKYSFEVIVVDDQSSDW